MARSLCPALALLFLLAGISTTHCGFAQNDFVIGGTTYEPTAFYVFDQSRGSPTPFSVDCIISGSPSSSLSWRALSSPLLDNITDLDGTNSIEVNGVSIRILFGEVSTAIRFDPTFLPEFSGLFCCRVSGSCRSFITITTANPFLEPFNIELRIQVALGSTTFDLPVRGLYTVSGGLSVAANASDYTLTYQLGGTTKTALQFGSTVSAVNQYLRRYGVVLADPILSPTVFTLFLTLGSSVANESITVEVLPELPPVPRRIVLLVGEALLIDCTPTPPSPITLLKDGDFLSSNPVVNITNVSLTDSAMYRCLLAGMSRDIDVVVLPGPLRVGFTEGQYQVSESATVVEVQVELMSGESEVTLNVFTVDGTASVSDDYDAVTMNVTLSTSNKTVSTFISIVNDETVELNEYFFVRIEAFIGPVEFVQRETEIVILNDDECPSSEARAPPTTLSSSDLFLSRCSRVCSFHFPPEGGSELEVPDLLGSRVQPLVHVVSSDYHLFLCIHMCNLHLRRGRLCPNY